MSLPAEKDFRTQLENIKVVKSITEVLPKSIDFNTFKQTVLGAIATHPQADSILNADRKSLLLACQKAAADGLLLDGRQAVLVARRNNKKGCTEVSYMPMTQGLVKLARNSGEVKSIIAEVVYENDVFDYKVGIDPQPIHSPDWFGERGLPVGAYAVVTTKDDEKIVSIMSKKEILAIGSGGMNSKQYEPTQGAHYKEWWRKTVIKKVLKYAPKSTVVERAP